ncbi:MAG: hypothetical protein Wins2KO_22310 [Winogradskyella sp.]
MKTQLHYYQFDFIKIKTEKIDRETVNWGILDEHPTIKNAYVLDEKSDLFSKNFKLYLNKNDEAIIETSIPYLINGHNYCELLSDDFKNAVEKLQALLNINLMDAKLLQIEYGCYGKINYNTKKLIKSLKHYPGYDLVYSSLGMKMFSYGELKFKIYDAVKNARNKKTFKLGDYPDNGLIKYELKITNVAKHLKSKFILSELFDSKNIFAFNQALNSHIKTVEKSNIIIKEIETQRFSMNEVLYGVLKMWELETHLNAYEFTNQFIDLCTMTPSQRSKRRKVLKKLELDSRQDI